MQKSVDLLTNSDANQAKLLFMKRREVQEFDSNGKVKTRTVVTTVKEPFEEMVVTRVVSRDDKPLTEDERKQQEETIRKNVVEWRARAHAQAASGPKKPSTKAEETNRMIREFAHAVDYKPVGTELIDGRTARIFEFQPRPGYKPPSMKYRVFEKMRGKVWIDQETSELVRADAEMFDDLSVGFGMVGQIGKGSTFKMERRPMAGVWVPTREQIRIQARLMLIKSFRQEIVNTFSQFKPGPGMTETAQVR